MIGLLDWLNGGAPATIDPRMMGLLGAAGAMSDAFTPQAASRLPPAKPNMAYLLTRAAGGLGGGYAAGLQAQGQEIQNLANAFPYNLRAAAFGMPGIPSMPSPFGTPAGASSGGATAPNAAGPTSANAPAGAIPQGAQGGPPSALPVLGATTPASAPGTAPAASPGAPMGNPGDILRHMMVNQAFGINLTPAQTALMQAGHNPYDLTDPTVKSVLETEATKDTPAYKGEVKKQEALGELGPHEAQAGFDAALKIRTEDTIARNKAFFETGIMPPPAGQSSMPQISLKGDIATPSGTVVPAPPAMTQFPGSDALMKQNANTAETEKKFGEARTNLDGTEARTITLAKALKAVQGGGLQTERAEIANNLRTFYPPLADMVMSGAETSAVQTAIGVQVLEVLGQLKQINQGTGGRILASEFQQLVKKEYGPDLSPEANYSLLTQTLGGIYQSKRLIDDYYSFAKPAGWRDANGYMSAWLGKPENRYQTMIDRAGKTIGPLKGMIAPAPEAAIKHLQMNPALAPDFDAKYGTGAAAKYLGGR